MTGIGSAFCLVIGRLEGRGLSVLLGADPKLGGWTDRDEALGYLGLADVATGHPTRRGWAVLAALWTEWPGEDEMPTPVCKYPWMAESAGYLAAGYELSKALPAREATKQGTVTPS